MSLLREGQQGIELLQIRRFHDDLRRGRKLRTRLGQGDHRLGGQGGVKCQQHAQRVVDGDLADVGRMVQDLQVVLGAAPFVAAGAEPVVGQAKTRRREQILAISVMRERAGFTHQRIDDVPIVNRRAVPADQARQRIDELIRVPDLDAVGEEPGFDLFTDEPTMHRIDVALKVNQAAGIDPAGHLQARRQPLLGQIPQRGHFLGETILPARVARRHGLPQEGYILLAAGELAAAAEQQRLIDGGLEVSVRRLRIAVLVRLPRVDPLTRHAVVRQQIAVTGLELAGRREVVDGGAQTVATVPPRHAAQFPQRILQTVGQGLKRFRRTQRHRLPVRVSQHEVVHHVIKPLTGNGDLQSIHVGEVGRRQIAGLVDLAEDDGLAGSMSGSPLPHTSFEGAAMRVEEPARMLTPQPVEKRLGEQPRLGLEPFLDRRPNRRKRIDPRAVSPRRPRLLPHAGQRTVIAVVPSRFVAHACSPGRRGQGNSRVEFAVQPTNLAIRNHRIPPSLRELRLCHVDRKEGILIVAG